MATREINSRKPLFCSTVAWSMNLVLSPRLSRSSRCKPALMKLTREGSIDSANWKNDELVRFEFSDMKCRRVSEAQSSTNFGYIPGSPPVRCNSQVFPVRSKDEPR